MKSVRILAKPGDVLDFFASNWETEIFRSEQDKRGSFISEIVERAAIYPMFIYNYNDSCASTQLESDNPEWAHFAAWWGGIANRAYDNPAIHDAYWLHEAYHKGYMTYRPGITFEGFKDKMFRNELNASMASEIELYMNHPEFRKLTFKHEIFVDRFLADPTVMLRWKKDMWGTRDALRVERKELMLRENRGDPVEYWIHKFAQQNEAWAAIWSRRFNLVEAQMAELHAAIDAGESPSAAMGRFMAWLQSEEITRGTDIPFPDEAEAFAGVYRLNSRHYTESIARGEMSLGRTP
jgi:hypothetical protein